MQIDNLNKKNQNEMLRKNKITTDQATKTLREIVGDDGRVNLLSDIDQNPIIISFGSRDDYNYLLTIDNEKNKYININLSFGTMKGFLSKDAMQNLPTLVYAENNSHRCIRGILAKNENSEDDIWMDFEVVYDSYSFPSITPSQLKQHIEIASDGIQNYLSHTLDNFQFLDDMDD